MENLLPSYIKTIEKITSLKLNNDLWVSLKCSTIETKRLENGSVIESVVGYWRNKITGSLNFYTSVCSAIYLEFRGVQSSSLMIKEEMKYSFIEFLKRTLKKVKSDEYYVYKNDVLYGLNIPNINESGEEVFESRAKFGTDLISRPTIIRDESKAKFLRGCELFYGKDVDIALTIEEIKTLIYHIDKIDLVLFTQNSINSVGWKLLQLQSVDKNNGKSQEIIAKIKILDGMNKEEMIGMMKSMSLSTDNIDDFNENELREALKDYLNNELDEGKNE